MREIKFRAWNSAINKFVYSDQENCCYFWGQDSEEQQYTGLKDKNGKEIYEGDIVMYEAPERTTLSVDIEMNRKQGEIVFIESEAAFRARFKGDGDLTMSYAARVFKVIGNVYQ